MYFLLVQNNLVRLPINSKSQNLSHEAKHGFTGKRKKNQSVMCNVCKNVYVETIQVRVKKNQLNYQKKNKFHSSEFQEKLAKMGLRVLKVDVASPIFHLQQCLQYTVAAKLAPQWNGVGNLLVQGRDFLVISDLLKAIKMDIFVAGSEITLCVTPKCVRLPHFQVETYRKLYEISENMISIQETCHVLPSLKKGNAVTLSRSIPRGSAFSNYVDMKKHWKNMYGYRLPETSEDNIWYLNIQFKIPFSPTYTYPIFCVKPSSMLEVPRMATGTTINSFMCDFLRNVTNLCGEKCKILDSKAAFPSLQLYTAQAVSGATLPKIGTSYNVMQNKHNSSALQRNKNDKVIMKTEDKINIKTKDKVDVKTEDISASSCTEAKNGFSSSFTNTSLFPCDMIRKNGNDRNVNSKETINNIHKKCRISESDKFEAKPRSSCQFFINDTENSQRNLSETKYAPTFTARKSVMNVQNIQKIKRNKFCNERSDSPHKEKSSFNKHETSIQIQKPRSSLNCKLEIQSRSSPVFAKDKTLKTDVKRVSSQKVERTPKISSVYKEKKVSRKMEDKNYSENNDVKKIKRRKTSRKV